MKARLKISYEKNIINNLMSKLNLKNKHQVPKITKIILRKLKIKLKKIDKIQNFLILKDLQKILKVNIKNFF